MLSRKPPHVQPGKCEGSSESPLTPGTGAGEVSYPRITLSREYGAKECGANGANSCMSWVEHSGRGAGLYEGQAAWAKCRAGWLLQILGRNHRSNAYGGVLRVRLTASRSLSLLRSGFGSRNRQACRADFSDTPPESSHFPCRFRPVSSRKRKPIAFGTPFAFRKDRRRRYGKRTY